MTSIASRGAQELELCPDCGDLPGNHLVYLGPLKLCMESGCSCGRNALARFALASAPWGVVLAAWAYLTFHLTLWAAKGFLVIATL